MDYLAQEVRITLKSFSSLTYNCTSEHQHLLYEINTELKDLMAKFKAKKLSRQRNLAMASASQLKSNLTRGRKKSDAAYRNRVGKKAQVLRKVTKLY